MLVAARDCLLTALLFRQLLSVNLMFIFQCQCSGRFSNFLSVPKIQVILALFFSFLKILHTAGRFQFSRCKLALHSPALCLTFAPDLAALSFEMALYTGCDKSCTENKLSDLNTYVYNG